MALTVNWTVPAITMHPVTAIPAAVTVDQATMVVTVNWSAQQGSTAHTVPVCASAITVQPVTPRQASAAAPQDMLEKPVLKSVLEECLVYIVVRSASVEITHATRKPGNVSAHLALWGNTVQHHVEQESMGQGVNNCASATMVVAAILSLVTAPAFQAGWAPPVVRRMYLSLRQVTIEDGLTSLLS